MKTCIVFYSWQSDLPNATNRGFIQKALENVAKAVRNDDSIQVEPVIDRDTLGVPGSPDIADTIFSKIEQAQIFVCDVSIINEDASRLTPNPNVLIELGYAKKALGQERIIMVLNEAYGRVEMLPFDLRLRRVIPYSMPEDSNDRAPERRKLEARLNEGLRVILGSIGGESLKTPSPKVSLQTWNGQYVSAEGGGKVVADCNEINEWATFDLIELEDNRIGLRTQNGDYLCAEGGGGREIVASRKVRSEWETFELVVLEGDRVALRTHIGQYVSAGNGGGGAVVADQNVCGEWETFRLIRHEEGIIAAQQ